MKKIITLFLAALMPVSLISCSKKQPAPAASAQPQATAAAPVFDEKIAEAGWAKQESLGNVKTEEGNTYAVVTVPEVYAGSDITQTNLDSEAGETYTSAKLNDDGSVTYKMTRDQYNAMLRTLNETWDKSFDEVVAGPNNAVTKIEHNDHYSVFDVTLNTDKVGLAEGFLSFAFYAYGGRYGTYLGDEPKEIIVNYYAPDGKLISSESSAKFTN